MQYYARNSFGKDKALLKHYYQVTPYNKTVCNYDNSTNKTAVIFLVQLDSLIRPPYK